MSEQPSMATRLIAVRDALKDIHEDAARERKERSVLSHEWDRANAIADAIGYLNKALTIEARIRHDKRMKEIA